jgi:hypothetical protein
VSNIRGDRYVSVSKVMCSYNKDAESDTRSIECDEVEFEFSNSSGRLSRDYTILSHSLST